MDMGYQEVTTFAAVISVKAGSESKARDMRTEATIKFTEEKEARKRKGTEKSNEMDLELGSRKEDMGFLDENETTISVSYIGGG
ncbi:hypothetical protein ANO14919_029890 [Xylariales sp. No.14919]|nr:hypothetical protein ANO14919_029890 [Xylariales sp. No.14919]